MKINVRKVIFKLIPIIFFLIYFYILTSNYLKYSTKTHVNYVRSTNELPPTEDFLCISSSVISNGTDTIADYIITDILVNDRKTSLNQDHFLLDDYECWKTNYKQPVEPGDEIFVIIPKIDLTHKGYMLRNIARRGKYGNDVYKNGFEKDVFMTKVAVMTSLQLLSSPYDTDCVGYSISRSYCFLICQRDLRNITPSDQIKDQCFERCKKHDCTQIFFDFIFSKKNDYHQLSAVISKNKLLIETQPSSALPLYIQQTIGLITMFSEISMLDFQKPIFKIIWWFVRLMRRKMMWMRKFRRHWIKKIIFFTIIVGCLSHFAFSIGDYLRYRTSTEANIVDPMKRYVPNLGICLNHDLPDNLTFAQINLTTPENGLIFMGDEDFYETERVKKYFKTDQVCYSRYAKPFPSNTILTAQYEPFALFSSYKYNMLDVSFSFFDDIPRSKPQAWTGIIGRRGIEWKFATKIVEYMTLPSPYGSHCTEYKNVGVGSRLGCRDKCIVDSYIMEHASFPPGISNVDHLNIKGSKLPPSNELTSVCEMKCGNPNCKERRIELTKVRDSYPSVSGFTFFHSNHYLFIIMQPEQSPVDFITYTASLFALWLGFSGTFFLDRFDMIQIKKLIFLLFKYTVHLLLIFGFSVHFYLVLTGYMRYETVSSLSMGKPERIYLPSISLMFRYNKRTAKSTTDYEIDAFITADKLSEKFKDADNIIQSVSLPDSSDYRYTTVNMKDLKNYTFTYIWKWRKMFTLNLNLFKPYSYLSRKLEWFFYLNLTPKLGFKFDQDNNITKHTPLTTVILHTDNYIDIKQDRIALITKDAVLEPEVYRRKLLKHPYSTDCINYGDPIITKNSWFNCIVDRHIKEYGSIPSELTVPTKFNKTRGLMYLHIQNECTDKCLPRPACEKTSYELNKIQRVPKYNFADIIILLPKFEKSSEMFPKTTFFDLTILLADVFGLWLGIGLLLILKIINSLTTCQNIDDFLVGH